MRARFCSLLAVLFLAITGEAVAAKAIWIDTDPAIGAPWREVDDAYALIIAFHSPELRIVGISTTYGNASVHRTTAVARDLVQRFGENPVNVFAGAGSPRELAHATVATEALAEALRKERVTYIALGPLTNLASFLRLHPALARQIERVLFVGGRSPGRRLALGPNERLHIHDANVVKDPAAVRLVLQSGIPLTLAPVETSSRLLLNADDLRAISRKSTAGEFLARRSQGWLWFWTKFIHEDGGPIFDALAVLSQLAPELVRMERRFAYVDDAGNLIASRAGKTGARRVHFCTAVTADAKRLLLPRLQAPPADP